MSSATRIEGPGASEHERLGDAPVRQLIEAYVRLSGSSFRELSPQLYELTIDVNDRAAFGGRSSIRLAFSVEAVQIDAESEMAIVGSAFTEQLIDAIRARGTRRVAGPVAAVDADTTEMIQLPLPVHRGSAGIPVSQLARHSIGRLTARVVIRAGTSLEEHLVDSAVVDLATGLVLGGDVSTACSNQLSRGPQPESESNNAVPHAPRRKYQELIQHMLSDLEVKLRPQLQRIREKSQHELAHEVHRIERYYESLVDDLGRRDSETPEPEARRVYEAERKRRTEEERERHEVRATIHPVQLTEWEMLVQRVDWPIESIDGHLGTFTAMRPLAGDRVWTIGCPTCGITAPDALSVCVHDHVACTTCSRDCAVCASSFCTEHGIATCHVDDAAACDAHARTCRSCRRVHCTVHEGECSDGSHSACSTCLAPCGYCGRTVCDSHAENSADSAPRGARRFCRDCARRCEGGTGEIVGPDEVSACASCDRVVCERHQSMCTVDGKVHCSSHLRRTDRSRRLVCDRDRAACAFERNAIFASDEVRKCVTCGKIGCEVHVGTCFEDARPHCTTHLASVTDRAGLFACVDHRTVCHIDGAIFSMAGTESCPVCAERVCRAHEKRCDNCGRNVCTRDVSAQKRERCATCTLLAVTADPSDEVIAAANMILERPGRAKQWKVARDATHTVVEMDFGWTRRTVFVLRHGELKPEHAYARTALGSRQLRVA